MAQYVCAESAAYLIRIQKCFQKISPGTDICPAVFRAALLTTAKGGSDPSTHRRLSGYAKCGAFCSTHTVGYYSALKRKEILTHATTWKNLKDIMLSEISQLQMTTIV